MIMLSRRQLNPSWFYIIFPIFIFSWYHGRLGRKGAEDFLVNNNSPCSYLVRESDRKPGVYSLSYLSANKTISHFRITAICGDYYIGGRKFQSLQHLIGYYSKYGNLVKNEKLQHPVPSLKSVHLAYRIIAKFPFTGTPDSDELRYASFLSHSMFVCNIVDSLISGKHRGVIKVSVH